MGEPRIMDLYAHRDDEREGIIFAHNNVVEMLLSLRDRVKELEKWKEDQKDVSAVASQ